LQYRGIINFKGKKEVPAWLQPPGTRPIRRTLMDKVSVTRSSPPSIKTIVADEAFCGQVAALLLCAEGPIHDAFIGEPAEEVLEMVRWALSHEKDEGFETAEVLTEWAKKRGRGAWSERPRRLERKEPSRNGKLAGALIDFWSKHPEDLVALLDRVEASLNGRS
jgi:hypothetical protein